MLKKIGSRLRRDGIGATFKAVHGFLHHQWHAWRDEAMDRRYGIDTRGIVEANEVDCIGEHGTQSNGHEPIQRLLFERMLDAAAPDYAACTFIDFGSGKGRAVILAAHRPFHRVIGVEFSSALHAIAESNVSRFRTFMPTCVDIELRCEDAATTDIPPSSLLCFLYNPFGEVVLQKVCRRIFESFVAHPRQISILYRNPVCHHVLDECSFLRLTLATPDFRLYQTHP